MISKKVSAKESASGKKPIINKAYLDKAGKEFIPRDPIKSTLVAIGILFAASLVVRLIFFIPVAIAHITPLGDEYFFSSLGSSYAKVIAEFFENGFPIRLDFLMNRDNLATSPPLYGAILGFANLVSHGSENFARFIGVLFSALTTPAIYLLTQRLSSRKQAIVAAAIHMVFPGFISFSHYLLPENVFIFLVVMAAYFTVEAADEYYGLDAAIWAVLAGAFFGLASIARADGILFLFAATVWVRRSFETKKEGGNIAGALLIAGLLVATPYYAETIIVKERPVLLSDEAKQNFYLGNNPWTRAGSGSAYEYDVGKNYVNASIREYSAKNDVQPDQAARNLALKFIVRNPGAFLLNAFYRFRMLWSGDFITLQHFFRLSYPPMPSYVVVSIWAVSVFFLLFLALSAFFGFFANTEKFNHKNLLLTFIGLGMIPPLLSIATPRSALPLLAMMLPAAGVGLTSDWQKASKKTAIIAGVLSLSLIILMLSSLPVIAGAYLKPSAHYSGLVYKLNNIFGLKTGSSDTVELKIYSAVLYDRVVVKPVTDGYYIEYIPNTESALSVDSGFNFLNFSLLSDGTNPNPPELAISFGSSGKTVNIKPIQKASRLKYAKAADPAIEYVWR